MHKIYALLAVRLHMQYELLKADYPNFSLPYFKDLNCDAPTDLVGNGLCNDEANNVQCNYDGGDCCLACVNTEDCTECVCHVGGETTFDLSCK